MYNVDTDQWNYVTRIKVYTFLVHIDYFHRIWNGKKLMIFRLGNSGKLCLESSVQFESFMKL